jgi:uncharacterized protein
MTKTHILDYLSMHKSEFKEKYGVEEIGLFGSYARDEAKEDSDIDVFVTMQAKFDNVMGLKFDLEESLHKKVDLITKHKYMKPFLLQMITKDVIYV